MKNLLWRGIARVVSKPVVADYLIRRAIKTPFSHLPSNDDPSYMARYWLFNAYPVSSQDRKRWQFPWSIRLHNIKRADDDRAMHDHPWNARTIILKGGYIEKRLLRNDDPAAKAALAAVIDHPEMSSFDWANAETTETITRLPGNTATLKHNEYHQITDVLDGTWTMFISGPWLGDWGFLVNGKKIWWRKYLNADPYIDPVREKEHEQQIYTAGFTEDQLRSRALNLGPLAKLVQDDGEELADLRMDRKRNINKEFGKFGSASSILNFPVASNSPTDTTTNVNPLIIASDIKFRQGMADLKEFKRRRGTGIIASDKTAASVGEYDIVGRVEADTLSRVICCTNCEDGCPACDPENLFGWKTA